MVLCGAMVAFCNAWMSFCLSRLSGRAVPDRLARARGGLLLFLQPPVHGSQQRADRLAACASRQPGCPGLHRTQHVDRGERDCRVRATHAQSGVGRDCGLKTANPVPGARLACAAGAPRTRPIRCLRVFDSSLMIARKERLTTRSEPLSGGRGRRAQNRSARVVHADPEHRPRPPGGERSRVVSRSKCCQRLAERPTRQRVTRPSARRTVWPFPTNSYASAEQAYHSGSPCDPPRRPSWCDAKPPTAR